MTKLKLGPLADDRPVKLSVVLPASVHRDLIAYAQILAGATGRGAPVEPAKLIVPMLERFMATDRAFAKARRGKTAQFADPASSPSAVPAFGADKSG
jgi:hypothetical protein